MSLPVPPIYTVPWASVGGVYGLIPVTPPGSPANAASQDEGFPPVTMQPEVSGGLPPLGADMNGILFMLSSHTLWLEAGQPYPFSSALASAIGGYPIGSVLGATDGSSLWYNILAGNSNDPDAGGAGWVPFYSYGEATQALAAVSVTLTAAQYRRGIIVLSGTLSANVNVVFPALFEQWIVINNCTGAFNVTAKTASGTGVVIPATGPSAPTSIYCDGTNIQNTGVSTAGLAPLASPLFTGNPRAPTPTTGNNTTSIATTAFVQTAIAPLASLSALAAAIAPLAPLASPHLTGVPQSTTNASPTDSSAQIATDAFVQAAIQAASGAITTAKGYVKIGPIIIQWGPLAAHSDSAYHLQTFAGGGGIAFPTACFGVVCQPVQPSQNAAIANAGTSVFVVQGVAATGFNYITSSNWNIGVVGIPGFYIAVGY